MTCQDEEFELLNRLVEQKNRELESFFDLVADGIGKFACNEEFTILYYNDGLADLCGVDRGVVEARGFNSSLYVHGEDIPRLRKAVEEAVESGEPFSLTYRLIHDDGHLIWVKTNGMLTGERYRGVYPVMYLFYTDVTEVVEANERLRVELARRRILMDLTGEMFVEYDHASDELMIMGAYGAYYDGPDCVERLSRFWIEHPDDRNAGFLRDLHGLVASAGAGASFERRLRRADGCLAWFSVTCRSIFGESGSRKKSVFRIVDIDDRKREEERLVRQATIDDLTGAHSRGAAIALISDRLARADGDALDVLMLFDFDDFKGVNDTYGHPCGDDVLAGGVAAIKRVVRECDVVGRLGGDEFCIFLASVASPADARAVAERIVSSLPDVGLATVGVPVTCSIGMSCSRGGSKTFERLYDEADRALASVKAAGRNGCGFYDGPAS